MVFNCTRPGSGQNAAQNPFVRVPQRPSPAQQQTRLLPAHSSVCALLTLACSRSRVRRPPPVAQTSAGVRSHRSHRSLYRRSNRLPFSRVLGGELDRKDRFLFDRIGFAGYSPFVTATSPRSPLPMPHRSLGDAEHLRFRPRLLPFPRCLNCLNCRWSNCNSDSGGGLRNSS